jgi:predicted DNA-binding transcriptional regulator AlpA
MLEDIQDDEDYNQFKEMLKLLGHSEDQIDSYLEKFKRVVAYKHARMLEALEALSQIKRPKYKSPLSCILYPSDKRLQTMPMFDRFVAYLLSEHTKTEVASWLGTNRMTLYRWLKDQGYNYNEDSQ